MPTHAGGVRRHGCLFLLDALLRSSAAAHHQPALICSGEALLALRLRCVASVCLCEWSVSAWACRLCKKDCIGAERGQSIVPPTSEGTTPHTHAAGVPDPVKRMHEYQYSTDTCNLARPPVHHRPPFRSCRVCSRPCHVLPSCTPVIHPPRGLRASGTVTCLIGMGRNQHRKHPCQLAGTQAIRLPNARNATRPLAADPTSGQPSQPAVAQTESQSRALYDLILLALYLSMARRHRIEATQ